MFTNWVNARRQSDRDAARQAAGGPARSDRRGSDAVERLPAREHRLRRRAPASSDQTIQFHGTGRSLHAERRDIARDALFERDHRHQQSGGDDADRRRSGSAVAFTYDLAQVGRLHAPGQSGLVGHRSATASAPIRSDDLFFGAKAGDVQPDWVDLNKIAIPQADEQQRLLWNIDAARSTRPKKPLPRFWYFPRMLKAVVIMTGDDHANGGTAGRFDRLHVAEHARLLGGRLDVHPRHLVHLPEHADHRRAGAASYVGSRASRSRCTSTRTARTGRRRRMRQLLQHAAGAVRDAASRRRAAPTTNRTHCMRRERLRDAGAGGAEQRHPARHELLLLPGDVDPRSSGPCSPDPACRCGSRPRPAR